MMITSRASLSSCVGAAAVLFIIVCSTTEILGASTSKPNSSKQSTATKAMPAEFKDAGKKAGLQIWRIEVNANSTNNLFEILCILVRIRVWAVYKTQKFDDLHAGHFILCRPFICFYVTTSVHCHALV